MRDKKLIQLYITNRCNSRCKTCGIWKNVLKKDQNLGYNINRVLSAFPDADYVIGGGEAILSPHIEMVLNTLTLRASKINYTLLSNCICLELLENLVEFHNVPAVTVSCDGINHDEIRGVSGNLENILRFRHFCDMVGVRFKISYTYSKYNERTFMDDMDMFKRVFEQDEIYFCLAQDMRLLKTYETDESFEAKNFEQILDCDMISDKDKAHVRSMITGVRRCCTSQNNVHTIYSNGDIVRCQSFKSSDVLGNINNMSMEQIREVLNSVNNNKCKYDAECNLLCQRRYD